MNTARARVLIMQAGLPPADAFLLIRVLDMQGLSEGACTLSTRRLAEDCGLHPKSAERSLLRLEKSGWLSVERTPGRRGRRRVLMPATADSEMLGTPRHTAGTVNGDPPHGGEQPPAQERGPVEDDPAARRGHPPPHGGGTPLHLAGTPPAARRGATESTRESTIESTIDPSTEAPVLSEVLAGVTVTGSHDEPDRMLARLKFGALVKALGGIYEEPDVELHRMVALTVRAYAVKRGRQFSEVLDEWLLEWASVAEERHAGSWRLWVRAKGAAPDGGNPWTKRGGRSKSDYRPLSAEMAPGVGTGAFKQIPVGFDDGASRQKEKLSA